MYYVPVYRSDWRETISEFLFAGNDDDDSKIIRAKYIHVPSVRKNLTAALNENYRLPSVRLPETTREIGTGLVTIHRGYRKIDEFYAIFPGGGRGRGGGR